MTILIEGAADRTGVMLALVPPREVAEALAHPDGEPVEEHHITLWYLGDTESNGGDDGRDRLHRAVLDFILSSGHGPLTGRVGGYGAFQPSEGSDGGWVLYAGWDVKGLDAFRVDLGRHLEDHGIDPNVSEHGLFPHETVRYSDEPIKELPDLPDLPKKVEFGSIVVAWAGEWQHYPLLRA